MRWMWEELNVFEIQIYGMLRMRHEGEGQEARVARSGWQRREEPGVVGGSGTETLAVGLGLSCAEQKGEPC